MLNLLGREFVKVAGRACGRGAGRVGACAAVLAACGGAGAAPLGVVEVVAAQGEAVPGLSGVTYRQLNHLLPPTIDGEGRVLYEAFLGPIFLPNEGDRALMFGRAGEVSVLTRNDGPAPGGVGKVRYYLDRLAQNGDGTVGFVCQLETADPVVGADDVGVWAGPAATPGMIGPIVKELDPLAGVGGGGLVIDTLTSTSAWVFSGGQTVFRGKLSGAGVTTSNDSVLAYSAGSVGAERGPFVVVAREGDLAPDASGMAGVSVFGTPDERVMVTPSGVVAFTAPAGLRGLWVGEPGSARLVARQGDPAPGAGGVRLISAPDGTMPMALGTDGHVAFVGQLDTADVFGGLSTAALFVGADAGSVEPVLREGEMAPWGIAAARYDQFFEVGVSDVKEEGGGFDVVVRATARGTGITALNDVGIVCLRTDGSEELMLREMAQAPGYAEGVSIGQILEGLSVNASGSATVIATLQGPGMTSSNNRVVYLLRPGCSAVPLLQTGGEVAVGSGTRVLGNVMKYAGDGGRSTARSGMNADGEVALLAAFTDGTSGILTAHLCAGEVDGDGVVTLNDYFAFLGAFFGQLDPLGGGGGGGGVTVGYSADVNCSGAVTIDDYFDYLGAFFAGLEGGC